MGLQKNQSFFILKWIIVDGKVFFLNLVFLYDHTSLSFFDLLDVSHIMFKGHKFFQSSFRRILVLFLYSLFVCLCLWMLVFNKKLVLFSFFIFPFLINIQFWQGDFFIVFAFEFFALIKFITQSTMTIFSTCIIILGNKHNFNLSYLFNHNFSLQLVMKNLM